nr:hypothetical protein CFP56_05104 [Quercus suber]
MDLGNGSETTLIECTSSQSFQAKLDEIDGELSHFDRVEDGSNSLQGGVGSRMMGSALFLKKLFTQEKSSSPTPSPSKFTHIPRKSNMVLDPLGVVLSKRSRQEEDGVLEEGRCRDTISRAWSCSPDGTPMYATAMKLKQCKQRLKAWSRDHFGHVQSNIKRTKEWL